MEKKNLLEIDLKEYIEKKNNLSYVSWANAWKVAIENDENAEWSVDLYDGKPYLYDENLGYMVSTKVTLGGKTIPMQLPVMDGANKAQKSTRYSYFVKNYQDPTKPIEKFVEPATMFDINTAIMRCLVKNLAMFGIGLYIYAGEDLLNGDNHETLTNNQSNSTRRI